MSWIFGQKAAASTEVSAPTRMPTTSGPVVREAANRRRRSIFGRSGRTSTVLTDQSSKGTTAYTNQVLGGS